MFKRQYIKNNIRNNNILNNIYFLEKIDSTNNYTKKQAFKGKNEGLIVVSDQQTSGKGRLQRTWYSPKGQNIYVSILLKPSINLKDVNILTFLSSVSTVKTIEDVGLKAKIKWPNDVVIGDRKVSGVLTEMQSTKDRLEFIIVGIGINLNMTEEDLKQYEDLSNTATSLLIESKELIDRDNFLITLIKNLELVYEDFLAHGKEPVIQSWLNNWNGLNRDVLVDTDNESYIAKSVGIDEYGYLIVRRPNGEHNTIYAGDVKLV